MGCELELGAVQFENGKAEVTNEKVAKLFESWNYVVTKVEEKKAPTKKAPQKKTQNKK